MQLSQETSRAAEYLRDIFQSGKTLRLSGPNRLNGGHAFAFRVTAYGKESDFCLTREQLDDVPGTKEYRDAADVFSATTGGATPQSAKMRRRSRQQQVVACRGPK
jgi:hypothetical protein